MIPVEFSKEDLKAINYERYYHPHPRVQQKMEAIWLKNHGLNHILIAELTDVTPNTITNYLKEFKNGGIEKLKEVRFNQPKSELCKHMSTIEDYFKEHPFASIKEAVNKIEELTHIKRSEPQVRKFLKAMGIERRKVGTIPSKADLDEQETFKKEKLEPTLQEAKEGKRKVYSVDAAHFVLASFLGYLWSFTRIFIKAPAGRKRFNVLGALDVITHELYTITNDTYINAQSVCSLLRKLYDANLGIPITLILDNARYQKCALVQQLAKDLNIELLFLPPYSPNLNVIERLWKFVKKECLYSKYYSEFNTFKNVISNCLSCTHTTHKKALDFLLTLKFQSFEKSQIMTF